jgi:hypothetical protein
VPPWFRFGTPLPVAAGKPATRCIEAVAPPLAAPVARDSSLPLAAPVARDSSLRSRGFTPRPEPPPPRVPKSFSSSLALGRLVLSTPFGVSARTPPLPVTPQVNAPADLPTRTPYRLGGPRRGPRAYPPASLHRSNTWRRDGNLNPLSIACAFRPRLRPASPAADQPGCGTLGHPVGGIRTLLALLMPTFALPAAPGRLPPPLHC